MMIRTNLFKNNQTVVPAEIRAKAGIKENNKNIIVEWSENNSGEIVVNLRRKIDIQEGEGTLKAVKDYDINNLDKEIY